jgi:triacylglycerol lipase
VIAATLREIRARLRALGEDASMEAMFETGALYEPYHEHEPYAGVRVTRDLAYGPHLRQRLDVFASDPAPAELRPVIVFAHAGGFVEGNKRMGVTPYYDNVGLWALRGGAIGVTMNYRLAPEATWPAGTEDVGLVVDWLRAHARTYGGDPERIVLMGHSAGATHVASYVAGARDRGLAGAILVSGGYDLTALERFALELPDGELRQRYLARLHAYYGPDLTNLGERSVVAGLAASTTPLVVTCAELDPPSFQRQAALLLEGIVARRGRMIPSVCLPGHTHFSQILHLNARDGTLSLLLRAFLNDSTIGRTHAEA